MSKLKPTFLKEPFYQKKIKNYFDNENFDRSANLRNDANWYDKLDKKDIIYIPIWRSLNLFALKSDNLSEPVFLEFNDLKNFVPENYVKTFLGSYIVNRKKRYFISIDLSTLNEAEYFAKAGFTDIIYAVCVVPNKLSRISHIQEKYKCNLKILLDSIEIDNEIKNYSELNNKTFEILIEIDSGEGRGGLIPHSQKIYEIINVSLSSKFKIIGVLTHAGHSYKTDKKENIKKIAIKEREIALSASKFLRNYNNHCEIISIGSTPTIMEVDHLNGITEARSGDLLP